MFSLKKAWSILSYDQKKYLTLIFILSIVSMLLETLSIGIIFPLISIFMKGEIGSNFFSYFLTYGDPTGKQLIYIALSATVTIFLIKNLFLIFNHWYQMRFLQKISLEFSDKLFRDYLKRDYIFFLQTNTAQLIRNIKDEVPSFVEYIRALMVFFSEIVVLSGVAFILFLLDFIGTTIILLMVCLFAYIIYTSTRRKIDAYGKERIVIEGELNKHLIQGVAAAKEVKILDREEDLIHLFYKNLLKKRIITIFINFFLGLPKFAFEILIVCTFSVLVLLMLNIERDMIDIMQYLGVFAVASFRIVPAASRIFTSFQSIKFRKPTVDLLSEELDLKTNSYKTMNSQPKNSNISMKFQKEINLINLCFSYPVRKEFSLSEVSMNIKKGNFIGIIGETGSGKSTLINIFTGLLKPSAGKIEVDGLNIDSNLSAWHKKIGYVPQSIYLMDDTIRKNIAFGLRDEDIDNDLIKQAVEKASLTEFLKSLSNGLDTIVGEKGIRISGGQQQRIGIARALYREPEILILDEATSSLDSLTEKKIMDSVQLLKGKKTLIIVTHRLSTVNKCDKLFFINKGKIEKQGSPKEILQDL